MLIDSRLSVSVLNKHIVTRKIEISDLCCDITMCQEYSMKYLYSTSQISKLSLILCTFSVTGSVAGLFLTLQ